VAVDQPAAEKVGAGETAPATSTPLAANMETASVGRLLADAREAAGLTVAEVAQSLKFSPRQIQMLEADDYAALPGNTIVRGFVRSYARLLKLDIDSLLQVLEASIPSAPMDVRPPDNMGVAAQPGGLRELSPVVLVAIVLLMAGVLMALWHFFGPSGIRLGVTANRSEATLQQPVAPTQADTPAGQPILATPAAEPAAVPSGAQPLNAVNENSTPSLRFVFAERSWLEVTDATKQVLHSGENPAGSQLTLTGRPPFEMVIGNASKVSLTYGDRVVDLAPYIRAEVARLTLE
jgi:cytoskeleton protein RodZ